MRSMEYCSSPNCTEKSGRKLQKQYLGLFARGVVCGFVVAPLTYRFRDDVQT